MTQRAIGIALLVVDLLALSAPRLLGQSVPDHDFQRLDQMLEEKFGSTFGFSILIGSSQGIDHVASYGYTDPSESLRVDSLSLFNVASITKSVTALEVFRLIEQGKIALKDSIGSYVGHVPADKRAITIHDLLAHTSGFDQNYVCEGQRTADDALKSLLNDPLQFEPETSFGYSNENYELLAVIIERVTGRLYENVVREDILDPLGMTHSYFWNEVDSIANVAGRPERESDGPMLRDWDFIGSGGLYSTPTDLYRFWNGVRSHKLITKSSTEALFGSYFHTSSGIDIGYGWFVNDTTDWQSREIWTRGTESWGPNAVIRWFPDKDAVIIVCTNSGEMGDKQETGNRIVSKLLADYLWK